MEQKSNLHASDAAVRQMVELAGQNYHCSEIIVLLAMDSDEKNRDLLARAVSGLANGCGFCEETCAVLTAPTCVLSWYAGRASGKNDREDLLLMLEELSTWFGQEIEGKYKSTRCKDIVGDQVGTEAGKRICGKLILKAHAKVTEILSTHGYIGP